jgi:hypothetical protein
LSVAGFSFALRQAAVNSVVSTPGNDNFVGLPGAINTAVFSGAAAPYTLSVNSAGVVTVTYGGGRDSTDTLSGIQRLQFTDQNVAFDLNGPGSAGGIYRLYAAAFNRAPDLPGLGVIGYCNLIGGKAPRRLRQDSYIRPNSRNFML